MPCGHWRIAGPVTVKCACGSFQEAKAEVLDEAVQEAKTKVLDDAELRRVLDDAMVLLSETAEGYAPSLDRVKGCREVVYRIRRITRALENRRK